MKSIGFRFAMLRVLVFSWLAFCCMACDPVDEWGDPEYWTGIAAYKPDKVDSMELRVTYQAGDTV